MSIEVDIELPTLKEIKIAFRFLPNNIAAKHMAAALGRAIDPAFKRLKKNTPRGPTGNLKRAVRKKTKKYVRSGAGVALIGFAKPPRGTAVESRKSNELGYHAHVGYAVSCGADGHSCLSCVTCVICDPFPIRRQDAQPKSKAGVLSFHWQGAPSDHPRCMLRFYCAASHSS